MLVAEAARIVSKARLQRRLGWASNVSVATRLADVFSKAELIDDPPIVAVCRDASDDKFFACALAGAAGYIVSEDDDILAIPEYEGIRTVRAAAFLRLLDEARS